MENIKSEGRCIFCNKIFTKSGMSRHLATHFKKMEDKTPSKKIAYHVRIEAWEYFLNLLIDSKVTLGDIDGFLRAIWLECCGHMSSFEIKGKDYHIDWDAEDSEFGEPMNKSINKVFKPAMILNYQYDFGSTTQLQVKVLQSYKLDVKEEISLLSRNEPLGILCHVCEKKPGKAICTVEYDGPRVFCETCAKQHEKTCDDFAEYASMPIVNSPRTGVCAFMGGSIDKERDGIWVEAIK